MYYASNSIILRCERDGWFKEEQKKTNEIGNVIGKM